MHLSLHVVWFTFNPDTSTLNSGHFWQPWSVPWYSEMWTKGDRTLAVFSAIVNHWFKGSNSNKSNLLFRFICITGTVDKIVIRSLLWTIEVTMSGCWNTVILGKNSVANYLPALSLITMQINNRPHTDQGFYLMATWLYRCSKKKSYRIYMRISKIKREWDTAFQSGSEFALGAVKKCCITVIIAVERLLNSGNLQQKLEGRISIHCALLVNVQHGSA